MARPTSTICIAHIGKSPHIAQIHRKPHNSQEKLNLLPPSLSLIIGWNNWKYYQPEQKYHLVVSKQVNAACSQLAKPRRARCQPGKKEEEEGRKETPVFMCALYDG